MARHRIGGPAPGRWTLVAVGLAALGGEPSAAAPPADASPPATARVIAASLLRSPLAGAGPVALSPGALVAERPAGRRGASQVLVETVGAVRVVGHVPRAALGQRVTGAAGSRALVHLGDGSDAALYPGAEVRRIGHGRVETAGGVRLVGAAPDVTLAPDGPPFVFEAPQGPLLVVRAAVALRAGRGGAVRARLGPGQEVALVDPEGPGAPGGLVRVVTYGPVAVEGVLPREGLGPPVRRGLDGLADPLDGEWELLVDEPLRRAPEPASPVLGEVAGGARVVAREERGPWVRVETVGPVRAAGWLPARRLRRLSAAAEPALDPPPR